MFDCFACVEHEIFDGVIELDESYFGGARKEKRVHDLSALFGTSMT
jgi:hypothetical protein